MVLEEGLEHKKPEAALWFRRALALSDDSGPVRQYELKELVAHQAEWREHKRQINDAVGRGDLPLTFAASGLRTTFVDVVLGNLIRNGTIADPRARTAVPLFSGGRIPASFREVGCIIFDVSALMVAGWLGLLQKAIDTYHEIAIPAGALHDLFEGRGRIRRFQKSRLDRAKQFQEAVARGRIKVLPESRMSRDPLCDQVGIELARLLHSARQLNGVVVRPPPVKAVGADNECEVDLSAYANNLTDTHTILTTLVENGVVDELTERAARDYLRLQDRGWPAPAAVNRATPIFLDHLTLIYLHSAALFDPVLASFSDVYIDPGEKEEAAVIIDNETNTIEVLEIIDRVRVIVREGVASGKVDFGPRHKQPGDDDGIVPSTMNLVSNLMMADIVVIDDRALNKEPFAIDSRGHRARLVSSLDLIEDLALRGAIAQSDRRAFRHRLRTAGAVLIPIDVEEVVASALRSKHSESAEFRAIRENIGLTRMAEVPRFPAEIRWFASISMAIQHALIQLWERESDYSRAASLSDAVLGLRPRPEDWVDRWGDSAQPEWCDAVACMMTATLALPVELKSKEGTRAYNSWLETRVLGPLRASSPNHYRAVVERLRTLILNLSEAASDREST